MNFVALDFETANYPRESACSVGLVRFVDGAAADSFYSLIRPPVLYIRPEFTQIHGLTVEDVRHAPAFPDIWDSGILPFIGNLPLAAHHAAFDIGVLSGALEYYGLASPRLKYFCTLALARAVWPELKSHSLPRLGEEFRIAYNAHNALDDARACGIIACMAARKLSGAGLKETLKAAGMRMKSMKK